MASSQYCLRGSSTLDCKHTYNFARLPAARISPASCVHSVYLSSIILHSYDTSVSKSTTVAVAIAVVTNATQASQPASTSASLLAKPSTTTSQLAVMEQYRDASHQKRGKSVFSHDCRRPSFTTSSCPAVGLRNPALWRRLWSSSRALHLRQLAISPLMT